MCQYNFRTGDKYLSAPSAVLHMADYPSSVERDHSHGSDRTPEERGDLYDDHYKEACNQILRSLPSCRIVEPGKYKVKDEVFMCRQYGRD